MTIIEQHRDKDNNLHREDGPASIYENGSMHWRRHGKLHRVDGPAIINENMQQWWYNGKLHRLDGPAIIETGKIPRTEWWINNCDATLEIHQWANERDIDLNNLSPEDKCAIILEWGNYKA
jgi:hypothetical protein